MGLDLALRGAPLQLSDFGRPLTPDEQLAAEQTRAEMTSTPGRAWKSAGLGAKAASLWDAANAAYIDNDLERAQQLEAQAKEYGQRAGIMAVPIQETKDINGVGDAVDYATGHLVSGVRSTLPVIGASMAGGFLGGPVGAGLGALGAGYGLGREQSLSQSMQDEAIRNTRSYQDMRNTAHLQGLAEGALDALVPAAMTGKVFRGFTAKGLGPAFPQMMNYAEKRAWLEGQKTAARELAESGLGGAARHFGKNVAEGFGGEFITGGAQDVSGQMFQNELRGDPVGNVDWRQAFESALAEGVGGTGFGAIGGGAEIIGAHRANPDVGVAGSYDLGERTLGATYEKGKEALGFLYKDVVTKYAPVFREELGKTATWLHKEVKTVSEAIYPVLKEDTAAVVQAVVPDVVKAIAVLGYDAAKVAKVLGSDGLAAITQIAKDLTPEELRTEIDAAMTKVGDAAMVGASQGVQRQGVKNALDNAFREEGEVDETSDFAKKLGAGLGGGVRGGLEGLWNEGKKAVGHLWDKTGAVARDVGDWYMSRLKTANIDRDDTTNMLRQAASLLIDPNTALQRKGRSEKAASFDSVAASNETTVATLPLMRKLIDDVGLNNEHPLVARFAELEAKAKAAGSPQSLRQADRTTLGKLVNEFSDLMDDKRAISRLTEGDEQVPHSRAKRSENKELDLFFREDVQAITQELFANTSLGKSPEQINEAVDGVVRMIDGIANKRSTKAKPGERSVNYTARAKAFAEYLAGTFGRDAVENFFYKLEEMADVRYGPESVQGLRLARSRGRDTANFVEKMTTPGKNGRPLINPDAWDDTGDDSPSARARRGNRLIRDLLQVVRDAREAEARPVLSDEEVLSRTSAADGKVAAYLNRREALADAGKRKYLNDFMQALVQRGVIQEENVQRVLSELEAYEDSGEEGPNKHDPVPDADQAASRVVELEDDNDYEEQQGAFEYEYDSEVDRGKDERLQHLKDQTYSHTGASERFSGLTWHGAESMSGEQTGKALKSGGVPTPVNRYNLTSTKEKDRFLNETQVLGAELRSRYGPRTTSQEFVRVVDWAEERHATHGDNEFTLLRAARDKVLEYDAEKQKRLLEKLAKTTDVNDKAAINKEIAAIDERKEYAKTNSPALFFDKYSAYGYYRLAQNPGENLKFTLKDLIRNSVREDEKMSEYVTRQARRDKAVATPFADEVYKKSIIPVQTTGTRKLRLDLPRLVKSAMGAHQQGDVEGNTDHARNPRSSGPLTPTEGFSENYRKGILNAVTAVLKEIQLTPDVAENPFGDKFIQSQMAMAHGNKQTMYNELDPDVVVWRDAESGTYFTYGELRGVLKDKDGNIRTENRRFVKALVPQNTTDSRGRTLTENVTKITSQVWTPGSMTAETLAKIAIPNDKPRKTEALDPSRGIYTNGLVKPGEPGKFWHLNARGLLSHMLTRAGHDASALMQEGLPEKLAVRLMWEGIQELREQGYELREASSDLATKITLYRDGEWLNEDGERVPREVKLGDMLGAIHPNSPNTTSHDIETVKHEELKGGLDGLRKKMGFTTKEDDGEYKKYKDKEARGEALDDSEVIEKKAIETKMDFEKFVAVSLQRRVLKMARERLADSLEQQFSHAKKEADKTYERTLKNNKAGKTDLGTKGVNRTLAIELTILDRTENSAVAKTLAQYDNEIAKLDKKIAAWAAKEKMSVEQADKLVRDLDKDLRKQERLENDSGWATGEPTDGTERALRYDPMEMENIRINEIVRELKALSGGDPALFDLAAEFGRSFAPKNEYAANSKLREVAKHIELLKNHLEKKMIGKKSPDHNAEVSRLKDQISTAERAEEALLSQQTAVLDKINDGIESLFAERGGTEADLASYEADLKIIRDRQKTLLADNNMDAKEKTKRLNFLGKDAAHTSARIVSLRERLAKIGAREEMDSGARKAARQSLTHNPSTTKAASVGRDLQRAMDEKARLEKDEASLTDSIAELKALINGHADHTKLDHLTSSEKKLDTATRLRRQKVNRQAHLKSLEKRLADPARKEAVQQQLNEADANIARLQKELQAAEARAQKTPQAALAVDPRTIKPVTGDKQAERAAQKTAEDKSKGQWKHLVSEARTFVWNERKRLVKEGLLDESVLGEDGKQLNLPDHEVVTLYQDFMEKWDTQYAESLQDEAPQTEVPQTEAAQQPMTVEKIMEQVMSGKFKDAVQREVLPTLSEADTWKLYEKLKQANRRPGTDRAATLGVLDVMGYNELSYASWLAKQEVLFSKAKRKGMAQLSRAKSPDADAKPSEDYQPGEEFKRIIGETFGFKLVGKEDWAAKWTLDDKGRLKDVLMSFYGLNEAESIGMERHEAWHGVEQLLEGMGDVGKQILDDITSWADSEHARAWLAKKLEPYPDALADIDDTKNPKLAAKERKAYAFQFFMEEGKMPPGKAQGWFNKIKEAIRKFFNWTGLKTTSDLQRAEAFFKYVGEGNFLRDAENPASVLEGLGKTKTDKFVEDVKGAIKPISDAVDVLFAHTADRVKGMKIAAYTELLKIYEGESGKGGYMLAQRTQFNRHANMFIHMRKGKDEKALPGVVREFKEKFRGYLSQALSAEDIQNLYDKVNTFNHDAINDNMEAFLNDLRLYGGLKDKTPGELRNIASDIANKGYYYDENAPIRLFEKKPEIMEKWKERSPNGEIYRLVRIGTRMVERNRFFGKNDERLHNLLAQGNHEASAEQQELTRKVVDAFEGRLGGDLSPGMRTLFNALTTANNIRLLPMAVFSQMLDPVRLAARKNDFASSLDPLFKGIKDMPRAWFDNAEKQGAKDTWEKLAEETGILANLALGNMMSELNLGYRMGGKLGWLNDKFFKYNFMEQWERSMTVSATKMGVEFLREHSASKTAQSKRYLDELGLDSGDVKFDKDGALITDEKVSAALAQYVAESLAHPDAGSNPLWMNDQRFALMSHLKRFSFAHQRYVLDRGVREYKLGNASILAPAVMAVPWMLTVDALRDAINPFSSTGYKADWGAADYLTSGMDRAGHTGKWQMPHDVMRNLTHGGDPFSPVLGPTADAFGRIVRKTRKGDGVEAMIDAIPGSSLFRPM